MARIIIPDIAVPPRPRPGAQKLVLEGGAFATTWRITAYATGDADVLRDALQVRCQAWLDQIDAEMSPFRDESDLSRFNRARIGEVVDLPPLSMCVVGHALEMAELTGGAFDPTVLPAVELWGFGARPVADSLPDIADVTALTARRPRWRDLLAHPPGCLIKPESMRLDLCAIAKGFAVDGLMDIVKTEPQVHSALVEVGGELKGWGIQPDGLPFWVEVESDDSDRTLIALCDRAVATSGDRRRSFTHDGQIYSHTIDAATASPTRSTIASATVVDEVCWRADALATALIVMGEDAATEFAEAHDIACLLTIRGADGSHDYLSPALERWL